jgi:hypothetical protein
LIYITNYKLVILLTLALALFKILTNYLKHHFAYIQCVGIKNWLVLILSVSFFINVNGQKPRKNFSVATSDNNTSIEKITVLNNELYSYGFGGSSFVFSVVNGNEQFFNVSSTRKLFIAKYNDTGMYTKAVSLGGNANNINGGMCSFTNNTIGISGVFGSGYYENNTKFSSLSKGMFITAIDSSLNFKWRLILNSNLNFNCNLIAPDGKGNFWAAGFFTDSLKVVTVQLKAKNHKDSIDRNKDIFILHLTQSGTILNTYIIGGYGHDYPTALTCDSAGNAIIAAVISDTVMLGDILYKQQSKSKSVLFKLSPLGKTSWITGFSGAGVSIASLSHNSKNEIVCGASFTGGLILKYKNSSQKITTDGVSNQILIAVFDNNGKVLQYKTESSENAVKLKAICVDKDDNIFASGTFQCTFTGYNKQNETFSFKNIGFNDIFQSAYDNKLNPLWQKHAGGPREDNLTDIDIWHNRPTIAGYYSQRFSVTCDSIIPMFNGYAGSQRTYVGNNSANPFYLDVIGGSKYSSGRTNNAGFFSNIMDATSPQLNYYKETILTTPEFTEKPMWLKEIYNFSDTFCDAAGLYFSWVKDGNIEQDYDIRFNGPFVDYYVNGVKKTYRQIYNEPITTTSGIFKLDLKTIDGCYSESIQTKLTIIKRVSVEIGYDLTKLVNNQYVVICKNDSTKLTANKTYGLKYFWVVEYQDYLLDTGRYSDTVNKMVYQTVKRDTFYTKTIFINKSAQVSLIVPHDNDICVESRGISIRKLSFEKDDSLIAEFIEESDSLCTANTSVSTAFKLKILDKKTGLFKNVTFFLDYKINGVSASPYTAYTNQNIGFSVNKSDTVRIEGTMNLGCEKRKFSIKKYYNFVKPKINFTGKLSKCRDEEQIFTADSTFKKYNWSVYGTPVKPVITYITPWKIKVKGSVSYIAVTGWLDTIPYNSCAASAYKSINYNTTSAINSNTTPPIICPNKSIVLSVDDGKDYFWFPNGERTKQITTNQAGIYYCTYLDTAGCPIKSNSLELAESFKPDLLIEPDDGICPGQNAEIFVMVPKYAPIIWQQPAAWGNKNRITTNITGIVKCSTNVCNTPYIMQAVIALKKHNSQTVYHYDSICPGQSVKMESHDSETYIHQWSYLKNVVYKDSKIINYIAGQPISNKKIITSDSAGVYLIEAKDACDNWYKTDFYIIKNRTTAGSNKLVQKGICGLDSFLFDIKAVTNYKIDTFSKCRWLLDNDTSFVKKIYSTTSQYLALITNKYCTSVDTITLNVKNKVKPTLSIIGKTEVCKGDTINLQALIKEQGWDNSNIVWNNNLGNGPDKTVTINTTSLFKASISDTCGISSDSITVVSRTVKADFVSDYDYNLDKTLLLDKSTGININKWNWYLDNVTLSNFKNTEILNPWKTDYQVCLTIFNTIGCSDSVCKILPVYTNNDFYIPTVFNPTSGFSINSRFAPVGRINLKYEMVIFNRWGQKLFEGGNETLGWDGTFMGKCCQDGAYLYLLNVTYTDPKGFYIEKKLNGTVMLIK